MTPTGGLVYHIALTEILHNIDEEQDRGLLEKLMRLDDLATELGATNYAVAIAEKE